MPFLLIAYYGRATIKARLQVMSEVTVLGDFLCITLMEGTGTSRCRFRD